MTSQVRGLSQQSGEQSVQLPKGLEPLGAGKGPGAPKVVKGGPGRIKGDASLAG